MERLRVEIRNGLEIRMHTLFVRHVRTAACFREVKRKRDMQGSVTGRQEACTMNRRLCALVLAIVIAGLWSENAMSASPPLPTLPLQHDIWITGTVQRGSGEYAPGDYTTIMLDRPSTSPCNHKVVSDILLGEGGEPSPTLLLPYLKQRVAVRGRVSCPDSGIEFTPQPDVVFPVW
ncbi:hypothetical protein VSR73_08355 [Paraburkholderia ferrariae]|uniref:TIGR04076 family protein n=2 Tax=Paraburkholderia ferrariae TaxID=386056 RepID=A0ABU9RLX6_9BURK